jgi:hypothetical protein
MANRYWRGGSGTWDTTTTTNWSATSGGAGGASVPTASDSVFFDQAGTYTVTMTGALNCLDFNVSAGAVTFATGTSPTLNIAGSMSITNVTPTWSSTAAVTFTATTTGKTITTNGVSISGAVSFNGVGGGWTLGSALTCSSTFNVLAGTLDTSASNYAITANSISAAGSSLAQLNLNASTVTLSAGIAVSFSNTNFTLNAGTSQINCTVAGALTFTGNGATFYNVAFNGTFAGPTNNTINGQNTFNNLSITGPSTAGVRNILMAASQTINGVLSTNGTAGNRRVFLCSATTGLQWNLVVNSAPSLTDTDFRDLRVIGTAAPISGTRIGNNAGCSGITFSAPKTVYWNLAAGGNWSATAWATSSGGTASTDNHPLGQDTAIIVDTGLTTGNTITLDTAIPYIGTIDMSSRTLAMTLTNSINNIIVYGDWKNSSAMTLAGTGSITFAGRNTQTIISAGKIFSTQTSGLIVDSPGGTVQLGDAFNTGTNLFVITNGTFDTKGYAFSSAGINTSNTNVRTINLNNSTCTFNTANPLTATVANLTLNAGTSTVNLTASGGSFSATGPLTFYNINATASSAAQYFLTLAAGLTVNNLTFTPSSAYLYHILLSGTLTVNGTLSCSGNSGNVRVMLYSATIGTPATISVNTFSSPTDIDFRDIVITGNAVSGGNISGTRLGDCGGNSGITFANPKTVYWNLTGSVYWSANGWATSSGGTPATTNFPLAQDTAIIDNTGAATSISFEVDWNVGTIDMSGRTSSVTLTSFNANGYPKIRFDLKLGTGVTNAGTGAFTFTGRSITQTITTNGVTISQPITINSIGGTVQLADALTGTGVLTITSGTFNAVTYNVSIASFTATSGTLKMGSGTWTLTSTGTIWNAIAGLATLIPGTSTIVLSNTSTTARTFNGGAYSYNKITIGGTTGVSTTSISVTGIIGELASTKTVAHNIGLSGTTLIGKWSVTGTAGNVVTIVGPTTLNIYGPGVSGVDYLSFSGITLASTSPGEFWAGANSTGGTNITLTAAPAARNLFWVGGTGNWSSTTSWSTSSGGSSGAAIPTSRDSVTFNSASSASAYTATIDPTQARCAALTINNPASGAVTIAGTTSIAIHGSVNISSLITRTYSGSIQLAGNSSYTLSVGVSLASTMGIYGVGSTWTLGAAFTNSGTFIHVVGTFDTGGYAFTNGLNWIINSTYPKTLNLNASTFTIYNINSLNTDYVTVNAGTSTIVVTSTVASFTGSSSITLYNVTFTSVFGNSFTTTVDLTMNNLTFAKSSSVGNHLGPILSAGRTYNCNTCTVTMPNTGASMMLMSATGTLVTTPITTPVPAVINAASFSYTPYNGSGVIFRGISANGASVPWSGVRFGDGGYNSGITFDASKTSYFVGGANTIVSYGPSLTTLNFSNTSGGSASANAFPLPQDTIIFDANSFSGSNTGIGINYAYGSDGVYLPSTVDFSRMNKPFVLRNDGPAVYYYGNVIFSNNMTTVVGTINPTSTQSVSVITRGSNVAWYTNSVSIGDNLQIVMSNNETFTVGDNLNINAFSGASPPAGINHYSGTLNFNGNPISIGTYNAGVGNTSMVKPINFGSGSSVTIKYTPWTSIAGQTISGTGTIIMNSSSAKTFAGNNVNYSITLDQAGSGTLTISGNNTFNSISSSYSKNGLGNTSISLGTTTQIVSSFTAGGSSNTSILSLSGTSAASPSILIDTGGNINTDYITASFIKGYDLFSKWYVGSHSTNGGTYGLLFYAPIYSIGGQFFSFF